MNRIGSAVLMAFGVCVVWPCGMAQAGGEELDKLLRIMPSDFPMMIVVQDMAALDKTTTTIKKRFEPSNQDAGMMAQMQGEIGIAEWADLSKPMGVGVPAFGGAEWQGVLWLWIDDFAGKAKGVSGATETEGVWTLPFEGKDTLFARAEGEYVVVSNAQAALAQVGKDGQRLAASWKSVGKLFGKRDVWVHLNFEPMRTMALGKVAQAAQMAPMFAMMAGAQGGADPAVLTGMVTALMDGVEKYVEQIGTVDAFIGLSKNQADVTLATIYKDGAIKSYLAKQKTAAVAPFEDVGEQPYFMAFGYHIPGAESPFFDYALAKISAATQAPPPQPGTEAKGADDMKKALESMREFFRKLEGQNMVMGVSPGGMRVVGDYQGRDVKGLFEAVKESFIISNPLMEQFNAGTQYEALGSKAVGNVNVEEFALKVDTTNPAAASLLQMYGGNPRMTIGTVDDRVRFCMGSELPLQQIFAGKVEKPFASNQHVSKVLSALPSKRNAVLLIDPMGVLPLLGPMMGMPPAGDQQPGPPIGVSVSFAGEPARVDIHVPFEAIERVTKAMQPQPSPPSPPSP